MTAQQLRETESDTAESLLEAWRCIASVSGSALFSGERYAQTAEQRRLVYEQACRALILVDGAYHDLTGKNPQHAIDAALNPAGEDVM